MSDSVEIITGLEPMKGEGSTGCEPELGGGRRADLPRGSRVYFGRDRELAELHAEVMNTAQTGWCLTVRPELGWFSDGRGVVGVEESGEGVGFFGQLHPRVDGYEWYRGFRIELDGGSQVLMYTPWIYPQESRPVLVLTLGEVAEEVVRDIVDVYMACQWAMVDRP